ncbi:MAG: hypothetical protein V1253_07745, partial [Alphaproteobacteria bacterium]|nr:hypothetical protein [Alphaproteobacteria bacterium]
MPALSSPSFHQEKDIFSIPVGNIMKFLFNKKLKKVWGDDREVTLVNQEILNNKPVFRKLIAEYYREMAAALQEGGPTLEIGSGG